MDKPRIFLDTSALFAGIWSAAGGARMMLKLGELEVIQLVVSRQVLAEIENSLRLKAPLALGALALLLDHSRIEVTARGESSIPAAHRLVSHPADARIFASAMESGVVFFVTLDRKHFLENQLLRESVPFRVGTPGDFLAWFKLLA